MIYAQLSFLIGKGKKKKKKMMGRIKWLVFFILYKIEILL